MEGIAFGIEIETLVRPKLEDADIAQKFRSARWNDEEVLSLKEQRSNIEMLQSLLVGELSRAGYPAHTKTQSYEKWTVDRDASIREHVEKDGSRRFGMIGSANTFAIKANISQVGLELISPVQEDIVQAMTEITKVWEILLGIFQVKEDLSCSTHIHVGLKEGWSVSKLTGLAKGWLWFEPSFTNAVPSQGIIVFGLRQTTFATGPKKAPRPCNSTRKPTREVTSPRCFLILMKRIQLKT